MPKTVFDDNQNPIDPSSLFTDVLSDITNDKGEPKYKDVDTALAALKASQEHIAKLEAEAAEKDNELSTTREELAKIGSVDDFVKRLTENNSAPNTSTKEAEAPEFKPEDVAKIVAEQLAEKEKTSTVQNNITKVNEALVGKYGEKAAEIVKQKAASVGSTPAKLQELAGENPALVLGLFDGVSLPNSDPSTQGDVINNLEPKNEEGLQKPEKSLMLGASNKDVIEYMKKIRADVYKKLDIKE